MGKVILITGGQRSGKSSFAERMALELSNNPVYLATAMVRDAEFAKRVEIHKYRRGEQWTNVEECRYLSKIDFSGRVVVVDCITLWLSNIFWDISVDVEKEYMGKLSQVEMGVMAVNRSLEFLKEEFLKLTEQDATFIFVTNEIGFGGVSENRLQRQFTDLQGWGNQFVAENSNDVYLMVSGIRIKIK